MKNSLKILALAALSFLGAESTLLAGNETRNGGDAWVCESGMISVLDYSEAGDAHVDLDLGPPQGGYKEKIVYVLNRLKRLDPKRARLYHQRIKDLFAGEGKVVYYFLPFPNIPDSHHHQDLSHCRLEQVAYQVHPNRPGGTRYFFFRKTWDRMDDLNKAGLILHEIIYREALEFGHTDSVRARKFNALISSRLMDRLSSAGYLEILKELALPVYSTRP